MVKRWGVVAVVGAVVAVIALSAPVAVAASGASEKPSATEIGVSATEIRIAVIADVDNPIVPGELPIEADKCPAFAGQTFATANA